MDDRKTDVWLIMSSIMRHTFDNVNQKGRGPADDVLEAIHAVMHRVRAFQHRVVEDLPGSPTPMDAKVLGFFARNPGATQSDLATHSGRDKGQLARLVGGLRERGLLQAQADASDRRNLRLALTDEGKALHEKLQRRRRKLAQVAADGLGEEEKQQLLALLTRVQENLDRARES
ncbi:MarR family transcriptional regulator [Variovorax dokdonensis]|uniref:MarR family transcriptional regulator n=1 Tax=Variovorax dokdonensis TaxID=344883 RepID=A0ABT7N5L5_9BURK|nr:MarR family transcriptional regulator [Variovorax dokdonensis]MDM0043244.1 MarR family transcriptional regulator [Variovorax dokdonensis]